MKRLLHIYLVLMRLNFSSLLAYRTSFINSLIGSIGWSIISVVTMLLLTSRMSSVFGWSQKELLAATGLYSIIIGFFGMLFSRNFERFSRIIHLGQLDSILAKPIDSQFMLSFWIVNYASLFRVVLGMWYTNYIFSSMHVTVHFIYFIAFVILVVSGLLLLYSFWFIAITLTMWFTNLSNLVDFLYNFNNLSRYPSEILRQTGNAFVMIFIPLTLVSTLPVKTLLQKAAITDEIILLSASIFLFFISRKFWKFALRHYTSASG